MFGLLIVGFALFVFGYVYYYFYDICCLLTMCWFSGYFDFCLGLGLITVDIVGFVCLAFSFDFSGWFGLFVCLLD